MCCLEPCSHPWQPAVCTLQAGDSKSRLAIADRDSPDVYVYDARSGSNDPLETFRVGHAAPIAAMRFNGAHDAVISVDSKGVYILALQPLVTGAGRLLTKQDAVLGCHMKTRTA